MQFEARVKQSELLVELIEKNLWNPLKEELESTGGKLYHFCYGYERHIPEDIQDFLKKFRDRTSIFVRFMPDYLLGFEFEGKHFLYLLEYKTMTTPRYTAGDEQWNLGQIEADAFENYLSISGLGINLVVLIYCSYHSRPLLMDFLSEEVIIRPRTNVKHTCKGSGTPYYNIDLKKMRTIEEFLSQEVGIKCIDVARLIKQLLDDIKQHEQLSTKHDERSPYKDKTIDWYEPDCKNQDYREG